MWESKIFDQWRSYLSLKTNILVIFFILWNTGFIVAMYIFGDGFGSPITPGAGIVISIVCFIAGIFGFSVAVSTNVRKRLLEPTRSDNYRKKDFLLLGFVGIGLAIAMYFIPSLNV